MRTEELIERISKHEPLLAKAVSHMVRLEHDFPVLVFQIKPFQY